ncbi:RIKEN cDNA 2610204G22 [Mus musculus]|nr:RIKEN cDNA 2610204G22 [Mus musculus]
MYICGCFERLQASGSYSQACIRIRELLSVGLENGFVAKKSMHCSSRGLEVYFQQQHQASPCCL